MKSFSLTRARVNLITLVISSFVLFFHLGSNQLQSWDEAVYAESAKEMVVSGDYLTPHWNQEKFFQKPPLTIWATAVLFKVFGINEITARAFSALCGVGCIMLTLLIARFSLSESFAFLSALILLVTPVFNYHARQGTMDVPLTFFLLFALYGYLQSKKNARWWIVVGVVSGLAVMVKGPAAFPVLAAIALASVIAGERPWMLVQFWMGLAFFITVAGAWHLVIICVHGTSFLSEYVGSQILARSTTVVDTNSEGFFAYPRAIFYGFFPFSLLLIFALFRIWRLRTFPLVLALFVAIVLLLYTIIPTKHSWYLIPIYPILAIVVASIEWPHPFLYLPVLAIGLLLCIHLDRSVPSLHPLVPATIRKAQQGSGPFKVDIDLAPAVLFYSDRKICTKASNHSMSKMTRCP